MPTKLYTIKINIFNMTHLPYGDYNNIGVNCDFGHGVGYGWML